MVSLSVRAFLIFFLLLTALPLLHGRWVDRRALSRTGSNEPDCKRHTFQAWWEVVSPCLYPQIVGGRPSPSPSRSPSPPASPSPSPSAPLCQIPGPRNEHDAVIQAALDDLESLVVGSGPLLAKFNRAWDEVPSDYRGFCPGNFSSAVRWLRVAMRKAPQFLVDAPDFVGVPVTTVLLCYLKTNSGQQFFSNVAVNEKVRAVVRAWSTFLKSAESLAVLHDGPFGWMSPCARRVINLADFTLPNATAPHWGFDSWSAFFTRPLAPGVRPIMGGGAINPAAGTAESERADLLSSPGDVQVEVIHFNVSNQTEMWIKNEKYSLHEMCALPVVMFDSGSL